jgi:hypothetical protein
MMLSKIDRVTTALHNVINDQLKAYYVGHLDSNVVELASIFGFEGAVIDLVIFPEWVAPACSIFAAFYTLGKMAKSAKKFLGTLFSKK